MAIPSVTREHVLSFRQRATYLHRRLPPGRLVEPAFAGLQDSSPRSAVLALHARVRDVSPSAWKNPRFVQVWGPRGAVYVVPARDVAIFTLGRSPRNPVLAAAVRAAAERARRAFRARKAQSEAVRYDQTLEVNFRDLRIASMTGAVRSNGMEPRHPGGLSSLRTRRRNLPASSLHVGSSGQLGLRPLRNSPGGRADGQDPLAQPHAASFPTRSRRFIPSRRN